MHKIFDLCMASNLPLPELEPCDSKSPDINFLFFDEKQRFDASDIEWLHHWKTPDGEAFCSCGKMHGAFVLRFHGTVDFHISTNQRDITCFPRENVPASTVRHLLIDQVVPRVLGHRGWLVVHGSAVLMAGKAVAFVGESGLGKSTLAAYLHQQGHTILTDDCFRLDDDDPTRISMTPNYPGVRLFDDSSNEFLARSPRREVAHYTGKKRIAIGGIEDSMHQPLAAIFFLASPTDQTSETVEMTPVTGLQRIMHLVRCSFGLYGGADDELRRHFIKQGALANSPIPFLQLSYIRQFDQLPAVRQQILESLRAKPGQ